MKSITSAWVCFLLCLFFLLLYIWCSFGESVLSSWTFILVFFGYSHLFVFGCSFDSFLFVLSLVFPARWWWWRCSISFDLNTKTFICSLPPTYDDLWWFTWFHASWRTVTLCGCIMMIILKWGQRTLLHWLSVHYFFRCMSGILSSQPRDILFIYEILERL
jgi:hypothetical protein